MANPRFTRTKTLSKAIPKRTLPNRPIRPPPGPPPQGPSELDILTGEILQFIRAADEEDVEARAEVGKKLLKAQSLDPPGGFTHYVHTTFSFKIRTAQRQIQLHHLKNNNPTFFAIIAPCGANKAYQLVGYPPSILVDFLKRAHVIPSSGITKLPTQMDFKELLEVMKATYGKPAKPKHPPIFIKCKREAKALIKSLKTLIATNPDVDEDDLEDLHDQLTDILALVAKTYGLTP